MQSLTNKTWFIFYKGFQIWLTEEEATSVKTLMAGGQKIVEVSGRMLPLQEIALLKGEDNDRTEKIKRGEWMCQWGQWHQRNDQCAHDSKHLN